MVSTPSKCRFIGNPMLANTGAIAMIDPLEFAEC
jgi:hypothetical protein